MKSKFFGENGVNTGWRSDPLDPRKNARDNDNSYLYAHNPTIHHLLPNSLSAIVKTRQPLIEAYLFPATRTRIDTAAIVVKIDNVEYIHIGAGYNETTKKFTFTPPMSLSNGQHQLIILVRTLGEYDQLRHHALQRAGRRRADSHAAGGNLENELADSR